MKVFIKHITPIYLEMTSFEDEGPDLVATHVDVHYEFYQGQTQMTGKTAIDFNEYESMNHADVVASVTGEIRSMFL